jgi:small subunit ribosomal protein S16
MLRIRLRRVGKKKQPMYRIVVADSHAPRDGAFVESLGYYHPLDNPSTIVLDNERARHWLDRGAMPSDRVAKLLAIQGVEEIPAKLKTRIALGEERAKEAAKATKAEAAAEEAPTAEAAEAPAEAAAPAAEAAETAEATEEPPAAAATEEAPAEEAPTEAKVDEAPEAKAEGEKQADKPEAAATEEEKTAE